ncbi:MAG: helix-turn-helix domain-containing protein, partial [Oscillospiraceae bacterium]
SMNAVGRIGLIVPEINSLLDHEFVNGVYEQAKLLGYDVIVYTGIFNSIRELRFDSYIAGLENIYTLVCTQKLDGIIYSAERFHADEVIEKIFEYLGQTDTPCLILGREHEKFPSFEAEEFSAMYDITSHLIKKHNCHKLYCITGIPEHKSSVERLRGFTEACIDSGIEINEKDILYGYFWKGVSEQIGRDIAENRLERPDAVVCANDVMAISLINSLTENGIRVPEDIAVTGFDGSWDSIVCSPSLTTVQGRDKKFGADCVCKLYEMITGHTCTNIGFRQTIRYGKSCGCSVTDNDEIYLEEYVVNMMQKNIDKHTFIATDIIHRISNSASLSELSQKIDEVGHIFGGVDWIDICLCEDWQADLNNPDNFRQYGYSDNMYLLLSKRYGDNEKSQYLYPTKDILPALNKPHEPHFIVITSLQCNGQIFGYVAMAYKDSRSINIEESYVLWCDAISNGLKMLQKRLYIDNFNRQLEKLDTADPVTGMLNKCGFLVHFSEIVNRYIVNEKHSVLVLITYYPYEIGAIDLSSVIGDIIMNHCYNYLCAKIQERIFAIVLPIENNENETKSAEDIIALIETSLCERFATKQIPEFVINISQIASSEVSAAENILDKGVTKLLDKVKALESNFMDYKEQIYRLRRNIISNSQLEWDIQQLADKMCISRSHLQRLYKQLFSISIKEDIISARIKRAMQFLSHTDMRIQEIAIQCGYNNENHFIRQFKEKTGITASYYRKQNR